MRAARRVAMISMHTSPLATPGSGDAGGMNVYVLEVAKMLAARGTEVEIFTRATSSEQDPHTLVTDGVTVHHVTAGPYEGLRKEQLPGQMCRAFTAAVLHAEAHRPEGYYDLVHSQLLAVRTGRLGRRGALADPPGAQHAHDGQGQRTSRWPPGQPRTVRAGAGRGAGGGGRRRTDRQHGDRSR